MRLFLAFSSLAWASFAFAAEIACERFSVVSFRRSERVTSTLDVVLLARSSLMARAASCKALGLPLHGAIAFFCSGVLKNSQMACLREFLTKMACLTLQLKSKSKSSVMPSSDTSTAVAEYTCLRDVMMVSSVSFEPARTVALKMPILPQFTLPLSRTWTPSTLRSLNTFPRSLRRFATRPRKTGFAMHSAGSFKPNKAFHISCHILEQNFGSKALHLDTLATANLVCLTTISAMNSSSTLPSVSGATSKWSCLIASLSFEAAANSPCA
mmetsp:Transcript_114456/g.324793  ORF Transcript_114456/g.324793 Transcript_114456/m.324793 type:complete len:269 (-) Transcript_114456:265-1071(-)